MKNTMITDALWQEIEEGLEELESRFDGNEEKWMKDSFEFISSKGLTQDEFIAECNTRFPDPEVLDDSNLIKGHMEF
jgi:hypothetical protein